jgi:hypothetical protein
VVAVLSRPGNGHDINAVVTKNHSVQLIAPHCRTQGGNESGAT